MIVIIELGEFIYHVRYDLFTILPVDGEHKEYAYYNSYNPLFSHQEFMDFMQWSFVHYFHSLGRKVKNYYEKSPIYQNLYTEPLVDNKALLSYRTSISSFMENQRPFKEDSSLMYSVMIVGSNLIIGAEQIE